MACSIVRRRVESTLQPVEQLGELVAQTAFVIPVQANQLDVVVEGAQEVQVADPAQLWVIAGQLATLSVFVESEQVRANRFRQDEQQARHLAMLEALQGGA